MRITVVAFATAADALGGGELSVELEPGATVADLGDLLVERHPALAPIWPRLAVAIGGEIAAPGKVVEAGAEVALLPPVSGGDRRSSLGPGPLDLERIAASVASSGAGALVLFAGTVRDEHEGRQVASITYSAYEPMARDRLEAIARDLSDPAAGIDLVVHHRLGTLEVGETSVVVAASSPHRGAAFDAAGRALERVKAEVPIWKRERYADGSSRWREEEPLAPVRAAPPRSEPARTATNRGDER